MPREEFSEDLKRFRDLIRQEYETKSKFWKSALGGPKKFLAWMYPDRPLSSFDKTEQGKASNFLRGHSDALLNEPFFGEDKPKSARHRLPDHGGLSWHNLLLLMEAELQERDPQSSDQDEDKPLLIHFTHDRPRIIPHLLPVERDVCAQFHVWLKASTPSPLARMNTRPFDGYEILPIHLGTLLSHPDQTPPVDHIHNLIYVAPKSGPAGVDYESTLEQLRLMIGIKKWDELIPHLQQTKTLLVLSAVETIKISRTSEGARLVKALQSAPTADRTYVLFMADSHQSLDPRLESALFNAWHFKPPALATPAVNRTPLHEPENPEQVSQDTWTSFNEMLSEFEGAHDCQAWRDPTDFRVQMAEWAFSTGAQSPENQQNDDLRPCDIRMRAFLSANRQAYTMDVTLGFSRLSGLAPKNWTLAVLAHHRSVTIWLRHMDRDHVVGASHNKGCLQVLRFAALAGLWMRHRALERLSRLAVSVNQADSQGSKDLPPRSYFKGMSAHSLRTRLAHLIDLGVLKRRDHEVIDGKTDLIYMMPLGLRAIVAEVWKRDDPDQRSIAHLAFAEYLYFEEINRGDLSYESPYKVVGNRGRVFFLAEILRHMIRATEYKSLPIGKHAGQVNVRVDKEKWPLKFGDDPRKKDRFSFLFVPPGTDRQLILELAYTQIFSNLMNDYRGEKNALADRHGLMRLQAEAIIMLQAANLKLTNPQQMIDLRLSLADASFKLGTLPHARGLLEALIIQATKDKDNRTLVQALLSLITLETEAGNLDQVRTHATSCQKALDQLSNPTELPPIRRPELADFQLQLDASLAVLHTLGGAPEKTIALLHAADDKRHGPLPEHKKGEAQQTKLYNGHIDQIRATRPTGLAALGLVEAYLLKHRDIDLGTQTLKSKAEKERILKAKTELELARITCLENRGFGAQNIAFHASLIFAIQYARLQSLLNNELEAEAQFDSIRKHMHQNPVGIRNYLAFVEAASELLIRTDRPVRGFCMYLYPGYQIAAQLGFKTRQHRFARQGMHALQQIENNFANSRTKGWGTWIKQQLTTPGESVRKDIQKVAQAHGKDTPSDWVIPMATYPLINKSEAIASLASQADIATLRVKLRSDLQASAKD